MGTQSSGLISKRYGQRRRWEIHLYTLFQILGGLLFVAIFVMIAITLLPVFGLRQRRRLIGKGSGQNISLDRNEYTDWDDDVVDKRTNPVTLTI